MIENRANSVCILINTLSLGGAEKNCIVICNELAKKGVKVELWITKLENSHLFELIDKRVKIIAIPGKKIRYTILALKKLMQNCQCNTILIFNIELVIPAFFINKLFRLKIRLVARSISTLSIAYDENSNKIKKLIWLKIISYSFNRIESVTEQLKGRK